MDSLEYNTYSDLPFVGSLRVASLDTKYHADLFRELYNADVEPNYPESEDYAEFVLSSHFASADHFGYLTKRKCVWCLMTDGQRTPVGFTVVTEKRGGSIKFGPTVLTRDFRGLGLGSNFRLLVERQYPYARKAYNTLPDNNPAALGYVLRAGYRIEAHLASQYREGVGEFVVGKLLHTRVADQGRIAIKRVDIQGHLSIRDARELPHNEAVTIIKGLLSYAYGEIDDGFVCGLERAASSRPVVLSLKTKRIFIAYRQVRPIGLVIATPKRGGSMKCSPIAINANDTEAFANLLEHATRAFPERVSRKVYMHVPDFDSWLLQRARTHGFEPEGILRQPYRAGVNMVVLAKFTKGKGLDE